MIRYPPQEYCTIFGAASQAEHKFLAGCYFYTQNKEEMDNAKEEKETIQPVTERIR